VNQNHLTAYSYPNVEEQQHLEQPVQQLLREALIDEKQEEPPGFVLPRVVPESLLQKPDANVTSKENMLERDETRSIEHPKEEVEAMEIDNLDLAKLTIAENHTQSLISSTITPESAVSVSTNTDNTTSSNVEKIDLNVTTLKQVVNVV
jgi:hypothetical protein